MSIGEVCDRIMTGYLYILKSVKSGKFYTGSSDDYKRRLREHNEGKVKSTKGKRTWELVYKQLFQTIKEARQAEYKLKRYKSRKIIEQIVEEQIIKFTRR